MIEQIGNVSVERNNELGYTHYNVFKTDGPIDVYISDELRNFGLPFRKLKELAIAELDRVRNDPFGETSIDPHVYEDSFRAQRAVNRLEDELQALIGEPLAIKSSVSSQGENFYKREDLLDQYLFMRQLQLRAQEHLNDRQKATLEFLPVYGAIRVGNQEFLIMKYIKGANEIEDHALRFLTLGWMGSGDPYFEPGFSASEHRDFLEALGNDYVRHGCVRWRHISFALGEILGISINDLAGRNVLYYQDGKSKKYVIIDQLRNRVR